MSNAWKSAERLRGVYAITNVCTGVVYYGQSNDMAKRLTGHRNHLCRGTHSNPFLQASWDKYGARAFVFAPVYLIPHGEMTSRERRCIVDTHASGLRAFNMQDPTHVEPTCESTRAKISAASRGRKLSADARAHISTGLCGNKHMLGKVVPAETRAKISAAHKGHPKSATTKARISAGLMGHGVSDETRAKLSVAARGISPLTRANMSASARRRYHKNQLALVSA